MRRMIVFVIIAAVASSLLTVYARNQPTAPPPSPFHADTSISTAPDSVLGRKVHVFFRGADDMPFPSTSTGVSIAMKATYFEGNIIDNKPGWIEIENKAEANAPHAWIPLSSIAYIVAVPPADAPTTQPQ